MNGHVQVGVFSWLLLRDFTRVRAAGGCAFVLFESAVGEGDKTHAGLLVQSKCRLRSPHTLASHPRPILGAAFRAPVRQFEWVFWG